MTRIDGFGAWWVHKIPGYDGMCNRPFGHDMALEVWNAASLSSIPDFHAWWLHQGWNLLPCGCDRPKSMQFAELIWDTARGIPDAV